MAAIKSKPPRFRNCGGHAGLPISNCVSSPVQVQVVGSGSHGRVVRILNSTMMIAQQIVRNVRLHRSLVMCLTSVCTDREFGWRTKGATAEGPFSWT